MKLKLFISALSLISSLPASAAVSDYETERLLFSKSRTALNLSVRHAAELRRAREGCAIQKSAREIPSLCLKVVALEVKLGLKEKVRAAAEIKTLARNCMSRAQTAKNLSALKSALGSAEITSECRRAIAHRANELEYMLESR